MLLLFFLAAYNSYSVLPFIPSKYKSIEDNAWFEFGGADSLPRQQSTTAALPKGSIPVIFFMLPALLELTAYTLALLIISIALVYSLRL